MVYNWDAHEPKCYRLYIDEKKSLEEIMDIMRIEDNFTPSKRAYQTQFRRWNFPSKQNPAHKDGRLVARVKELWERNLSQKEILRILNDEDGFEIKHRELMRVRARNRWLLRTPNPHRTLMSDAAPDPNSNNLLSESDPEDEEVEDEEEAPEPNASAERSAKQKENEYGLSKESMVHWEARKGRRRIRVRSGSAAVSPGQPRFPSETTIDQSRIILGLDMKMYQQVRSRFSKLCEQDGVSRKTVAGPEKWEATKSRLIEEMPHLQSALWVDHDDLESRKLALDVICTDVTKRMRSMEHKLTIADAKSILGINPQQYRTMRQDFAGLLKDDHATSKTEAGPQHWEELKEQWRLNSNVVQEILATGVMDQDRLRAIDVVARDVMKRLRDGQGKNVSTKTRPKAIPQVSTGVMLGGDEADAHTPDSSNEDATEEVHEMDHDFIPASPIQYPRSSTPTILHSPNTADIRMGHDARHVTGQSHARDTRLGLQHHQSLHPALPQNSVLAPGPSQHHSSLLPDTLLSGGLPIDPHLSSTLPMLINDHSQNLGTQQSQPTFPLTQDLAPTLGSTSHTYVQSSYLPHPNPSPPVAVYLRLHPSSPITIAPPIWITTLTTRTLNELRQVACKDFAGTVCGRVEGVLDREMTIEVSRDDELTAYLMVFEGRNRSSMSGPPCFVVQLLPAEWKT
ncbi:hypothetical protein PFICI_13560 [Pestalotiopsis fici W106-1]|uniref:Uncharacterized protein n=1 Tax=Pestalotiopsis fici (strain W106-1 / CGMCC3.15140) TaxID=1229662 RepID=W3WQG8_PESFW|nr:uncharacterized protein PFICI_13560 [Pestalotiopsis fici W106-1]ETS75076.1 hypothetical protein PFICI_13560 [Pestalotiopsis fici W106-1]